MPLASKHLLNMEPKLPILIKFYSL
uniref:Uncharacterized protein n=1 Tax=Rhizophora mucronata TaxID=61149 RepID=A0A2P2QKA4_RHIMU